MLRFKQKRFDLSFDICDRYDVDSMTLIRLVISYSLVISYMEIFNVIRKAVVNLNQHTS